MRSVAMLLGLSIGFSASAARDATVSVNQINSSVILSVEKRSP
jgi:hypothetical protein